MTGRGPPAQRAAESTVGKNNPAGPEDDTGGKGRQIMHTSKELSLGAEQRQEIQKRIAAQNAPRLDRADFELMIGASVPRQVELRDLPSDISTVMGGYNGSQYVLVRGTLVVVDRESRRVVAIVPEMS
jgi:hypothetical protein